MQGERVNDYGEIKTRRMWVTENYYDNFSRVSIRGLGHILPDAGWALLPFMHFRQKKGDITSLLKRCSMIVKCFIDTDTSFDPMHSKLTVFRRSCNCYCCGCSALIFLDSF
ncbi:hypothetical protein Ddye_018329 [Dipteronia dyeriana]|uniref:Uncharacterized protein n=1 Tax=Dipteronia dyeriana TaxID=168575 RepID=A0AAD9UAV7_9ROSI|nr:hypothetical protein Ddye_018329 [Dipteronia dyeriana]